MSFYSPSHYRASDKRLITELIDRYGFATVITISDGEPFISQLPMIRASGELKLLGHSAKANPHWKLLASEPTSTFLFHGPHAYISPAWYEPAPGNVPTWNYATIHVQGKVTLIEDANAAYEVLLKTTQKFEADYGTGWSLPSEINPELENLLNHIVAFEVVVEKVEAKLKLSQKQSAVNRNGVIAKLPSHGDLASEVAELMKRT